MQVSFCPICKARPSEIRHGWLYKCGGCGLLSSTLKPAIPTAAQASRIDEASRARGLDPIRTRNNAIILERLKAFLPAGRRKLLDVGCGQGQFLTDARQQGFDVTGIEPDANVAPQTMTRIGAPVRQGFFPEVVAAGETFDAIVFNDVFEHIPDATGAIAACRRHLATGGILVLNCPNKDGVFYRAGDVLDRVGVTAPFDRLWQRNLPSPHVWYFTPRHLSMLGRSVGLETRDTLLLQPIVREGLADRIFHIEGQSRALGVVTYAATLVALPVLSLLPHDIGVVFMTPGHATSGAA